MARKSIKTKILGILFLSIFVITTVLGFLSFSFSRARLASMLGESIKGIAATAASFIKPVDISLIIANSDKIKERRLAAFSSKTYPSMYKKMSAPAESLTDIGMLDEVIALYLRNKTLLSNIKKMNNIDSPINIYVVENDRLRMVMTSDEVLLTDAVYAVRPEAAQTLSNLQPRATGIYKDKDGTWISAYSPVLSSDGSKPIAIIEINQKINSYLNRLKSELGAIILICLFASLAAAFLGFELVTKLVRSIKGLDDVAVELEKGNYNVAINIESDDEVGRLAKTFDDLRISIKNKIEELRLSVVREKRAHLESIIALTNAIEMRDPYTKEHLSRVVRYALLIAKAMKLPKDSMIKLKYGCFLHDIGKIYIENQLLQKIKLSGKDFEEIKKHPEMGAKMIEGINFLTDVREAVLYHQERYDGTGYPEGLKGEKIPLMARIVAVADSFDAMTTDRPYKSKIGCKEAMAEIEKNSGTQFDPKVVVALMKYRNSIAPIAKKHFKYPF